jgi:hypothetical protein
MNFTRQDHKSQNIGKMNKLKGFDSKYTKEPKDDSQNMTGTFKKKGETEIFVQCYTYQLQLDIL